jgi:hypothetical protein
VVGYCSKRLVWIWKEVLAQNDKRGNKEDGNLSLTDLHSNPFKGHA